MSYQISKSKRGTTIRALGKDAQALFDALQPKKEVPKMQMEIKDSEVKGVVVVMKDEWGAVSPWYLRMTAPGMEKSWHDHPFVWYQMTDMGWQSVCNTQGHKVEDELEAAYQEQI